VGESLLLVCMSTVCLYRTWRCVLSLVRPLGPTVFLAFGTRDANICRYVTDDERVGEVLLSLCIHVFIPGGAAACIYATLASLGRGWM
jgi:hypothetical protein